MKKSLLLSSLALGLALSTGVLAQEVKVNLSGAEENPPVTTSAKGVAVVKVNPDMTVSVTVTTSGVEATASHIHMAAKGANGGVIVPFTKQGDAWVSAPGAKFTPEQFAAFKAGNTYVNVHSKANPGGEIRGQIVP